MKFIFIVFTSLLFMSATAAEAEDGLVVHFTITKTVGNVSSTFTDAVLMRLTEASTLKLRDQYEMRLQSRDLGTKQVNLVITLKDVSSGKPIYAGSASTDLKVGASTTVALHQLQNALATYVIFVDTSYGQLPQAAQ